MKVWTEYLEKNKDRFREELFELLRFPSISADGAYKSDVLAAADYIKEKLIAAGADDVQLFQTPGYPIVFGQKQIDPQLPTVLIYGHYDVQPPDPIDLWTAEPFDPQVVDGNIVARGASDDKGQMYLHIKAFETMIATDSLNCNVKFMIEGEEEVGSSNLGPFLKANQDLLKSDLVLVSDTAMVANDCPSITVGLRGLSYLEVELTGPNRDLHSGVYGGAVGNPINILCQMIASLTDEDGRITIPHFYDEVQELSTAERNAMANIPFDESAYCEDLEVGKSQGEKGYSTIERASIRPTLDVNGIWGGYIGEGAKTVLPSKAYAKISMRLVPHQNSAKITQLFQDHFEKIAPSAVKIKVTPHHGGEPALTPTDSIAFKAASQAMLNTFGKTPIPTRGGGSIPIVALFEEILGLKTVLMGFGLDSDNIHSPDEKFGLFNYYKGIETVPHFFKALRDLSA